MSVTAVQQQLLHVLLGSSAITKISDVLNSESLSLVRIKKELGEETQQDILKIFITDLVNSFNIGKTMSESQIDSTCLLITEDFEYLKTADLLWFCKEAKKGRYGKLYDRIDCQIIIEWLTTYDEDRMEAAKRNKPKPDLSHTPILPKISIGEASTPVKLYERVRAPVEKKIEAKPVNTDPVYQMHQRWIKQFTDLSIKQSRWKGIRMVQKYGRWMDANAYLDHKQWQYNEFVILKNQ
jgi:hypothetical protein